MDKLIYLFQKHFTLRLVVTVGLCLITAVLIGSGLRGPAPATVPVLDIDQPARLASAKGSGASEQVQNVVANKAATNTQGTTIGSNGNVSSLSQAIKILATKPVNPDADKSVAGSGNTAVVKPADPAVAAQSGSVLTGKNNTTTGNQANSNATTGGK